VKFLFGVDFILYRAHGDDFYISVHFPSKPDTFEIRHVGQIATC
jgi:hypothetical protein